MELTYKIQTSKNNSQISTDSDFNSSLAEYDKYSFCFSITVLNNRKKIAFIEGQIFDEIAISDDGEDLINVADSFSGGVSDAIEVLYYSDFYNEIAYLPEYICYIDRFYIFPNARQRGIGSYLLNNLPNILKYF